MFITEKKLKHFTVIQSLISEKKAHSIEARTLAELRDSVFRTLRALEITLVNLEIGESKERTYKEIEAILNGTMK